MKQIGISELKSKMYVNDNNFQKYVLSINRKSVIPEQEYAYIKVIREPRQWQVKNTPYKAQMIEAILCEMKGGEMIMDSEQIYIHITSGDYTLLTKDQKVFPKLFKVVGNSYVNKFKKTINGRKWIDEERIQNPVGNKNSKPKKDLYLE